MQQEQETKPDPIISVRVPEPWLAKMDEAAVAFERKWGTKALRSDIMRMALARYLGVTSDTKADGE